MEVSTTQLLAYREENEESEMRADEANQQDMEMQELFEAEIKSKIIEDYNDGNLAEPWWVWMDQDITYIAEQEK